MIIAILLFSLIMISIFRYKTLDSYEIISVIPKHVYQTWNESELPYTIKEGMDDMRRKNPELQFHFFDDAMCRDFIEENFGNRVLNAYNTLIPGAYKADLWRYCLMYIKGGIYIDIKYVTVDDFKLVTLTDKEYYVRDNDYHGKEFVYNAILVSKPKNEIYKKCIDKIVKNVENRDYCKNELDVTGPSLLKTVLDENKEYLKNREYDFKKFKHRGSGEVYKNKKLVLKVYKRDEYYKVNKNHYSVLYSNKQIFK